MARIGFIGLGIMGSPMAANLVKAGHQVRGHDHHAANMGKLEKAGGAAAASVAEAVGDAEVVATMLQDSPQVAGAMLGEDGAFAALRQAGRRDVLYIDFSTISPQTSRDLAEAGAQAGVRVLDAPVSGGEAGAIDGKLSIMVGGAAADYEAALPVLRAVGTTLARVGPHGAGQVVKAANQIVVGGIYALVAEAIVLMEASGVDAKAGLDVLAGGLAGSRILDLKRETMLARQFKPGFRMELHHKDMGIAQAAARDAGVAVPVTGLVAQLIAAAQARGDGKLDHSALLRTIEALSGRGDGTADNPVSGPGSGPLMLGRR